MDLNHPSPFLGGGPGLPDQPPEQGLAEAFAIAVAARNDRLWIYPYESNRIRPAPWSAITSGRPYAVHINDADGYHCTPMDFDTRRGNAAADAEACAEMLRYLGIRHAETVSGPTGGRHLLTTWATSIAAPSVAELATALKSRYRTIDVSCLTNSPSACIRPPLAPHRLGGRSQPEGDPEIALEVLEIANLPEAFAEWLDLLGVHAQPVSRRIAALLVGGHWS